MAGASEVEIGFVEKPENWRLLSHFFPSKVGGKPAWLCLKQIPDFEKIKCPKCSKPCVFLVQIYANINEFDRCFHRTLYMFICKDPSCCTADNSSNIVVLRSQLPRDNDFFDIEPPNEDTFSWSETFPKAESYQELCVICGCAGPKRCAKCKLASYCSKEHQTIDWKNGHKLRCAEEGGESKGFEGFLFPEFDIVTESEDYVETKSDEKSEEEKMKEYHAFMQSMKGKEKLDGKGSKKDLEQMADGEQKLDKVFKQFKKRVEHEPEQILRYERHGQPLWVSSKCIPRPEDIPSCTCGAPRQFEFQVMPQLLRHLGVDSLGASLDWGTLAVYSCSQSCEEGGPYQREFVWKQDFTGDAES